MGDGTDAGASIDGPAVEATVAAFLRAIGEDPTRQGLARTPARVAEASRELLGGIGVDPVPALRAGRFAIPLVPDGTYPLASGTTQPAADASGDVPLTGPDQPVLLRGARFRSMCEHHLLPFTGTISLAYVPGDDIVGFGRLHDLVETVTTRLTLQERIGDDIVDALMAGLDARGALAVIDAVHGCVSLRGSRQEHGDAVTVAARGVLARPESRHEVMALIAAGPVPAGADATSDGTRVRGRFRPS